MSTPEPDWNLTEPFPSPEVYVDGHCALSVTSGVAKLTFFSIEHDPMSKVNHQRIVLRLTTPVVALFGLREGMNEIFTQIEDAARGTTRDAA